MMNCTAIVKTFFLTVFLAFIKISYSQSCGVHIMGPKRIKNNNIEIQTYSRAYYNSAVHTGGEFRVQLRKEVNKPFEILFISSNEKGHVEQKQTISFILENADTISFSFGNPAEIYRNLTIHYSSSDASTAIDYVNKHNLTIDILTKLSESPISEVHHSFMNYKKSVREIRSTKLQRMFTCFLLELEKYDTKK